jgi:hypothetical protein
VARQHRQRPRRWQQRSHVVNTGADTFSGGRNHCGGAWLSRHREHVIVVEGAAIIITAGPPVCHAGSNSPLAAPITASTDRPMLDVAGNNDLKSSTAII